MRDLVRELVDDARRSGDRIGVDGALTVPARLAAETIRLARLATSIHLAESVRLHVEPDRGRGRATPVREPVQ